jgi:hypothetical protein
MTFKALQLTRRRPGACQGYQPAGGRSGGRFAGRPPDVSFPLTGGAQLSAVSVMRPKTGSGQMAARRKRANPKRRSVKGALIKGMSRRLSAELLDDPLFRKSLQDIMRGNAGIYALYRGEHLYYAGLTRNLLGRIKLHQRDRHANRWDHFVIFRIHRVRFLKDVETLILNLVKPPGNRHIGHVPRDADLNRVLKETLREYRRRIRGYQRSIR